MAQIIGINPENNPRLREIYDILLLAGYFRIRVAGLKPFDKIVGGLAWCITCSNFEIDVQYNDEMILAEKIRVSEKICDALRKMKCPYDIRPNQIQGMDLNNIFPIVQWLIKFVYETREYRQKFNTTLSNFLGQRILKIQEAPSQVDKIAIPSKRITKNANIKTLTRNNPLRVYSALIEYGDVTSITTYNKLCAVVTGKVQNLQKGGKAALQQGKQLTKEQYSKLDADGKKDFSFADYMFTTKGDMQTSNEEEKKILESVGQQERNNFKKLERRMSFSGAQLEKLVTENRSKIEEALKQNEEQQESPEAQLAKLLQTENQSFQNQKQMFVKKLAALDRLEKEAQAKIEKVQVKAEEINEAYEAQKQKVEEIEQIKQEVEAELKQKTKAVNDLSTKQLQKLVDERARLKTQKTELKKTVKAKIEELKKQKTKAIQNIPQVDQQIFNKMMSEMKVKKKIYDQRFLQLTIVNQELAILQRKAQNFTSPTQIAQYHQRFIELFESINKQIEKKRDLYEISSHLESQKLLINNYVQNMRTFKEVYNNSKSKDDKKEFIGNLKEVYKIMETNMKNSQEVLKKVTDKKSTFYDEYIKLVKQQRQYYMILKELKNEVELSDYQAAQRANQS